MKETSLDKKVLEYFDSIGGYAYKHWGGGKYGKSGIPDIIACVNGKFYGIEDKTTTGRPSMLQLKNLEWIRNAGGYGILLYPKDFTNFTLFVTSPRGFMDWYKENIVFQNEWRKRLEKVT